MTTEAADGATVATPLFQVFKTGSLPPLPTADPASNFTPDGTITIIVPRSAIGSPVVGSQLNHFLTRIAIAGSTITPDNMPNNLTPAGSYAIVGNAFCAPNTAPLANLVAHPHGQPTAPPTGDPPITIDFDGSGSSDSDAGDTVASYTFDFGDGSAPVTQASPTISHTYTTNGDFGATLKVTDSRGKISSNTALVDIGVELPLNDAVSQKTHGTAGTFGIHLLNPGGTASIEMRGTGSTNNSYTLVYTFDSAYRVDRIDSNGSAVTAGGNSAGTAAGSPGPGTNQLTLTLTGISTAQHLVITANGIHVTRLSDNATATLNSTVPMDVLVGDVTGNRVVTNTDVGAVKAQVNPTQPVTEQNFRDDVSANGVVTNTDVGIVKAQVNPTGGLQ